MRRVKIAVPVLLFLFLPLLVPASPVQASPQVLISTGALACNNVITVSGYGWPTNTVLTVSIVQLSPSYVAPQQVTTDASGSFSNVQLYIPSGVAGGQDTVYVQAGATSVTAAFTLTCVGSSPPVLHVQPQQVAPGGTIQVSATHFPTNTSVTVNIIPQGGVIVVYKSFNSNSGGSFSGSIPLPSTAPGGAYAAAAMVASTTIASATFTVLSNPVVSNITPNPARPGQTVTVTGTSFPTSVTFTAYVTCANTTTQSTPQYASASGQITLTFVVPATTTPGQCQVQIYQEVTVAASATFQVQQSATVTLNPTSAPVGTTIYVTGAGLLPSASIVVQVPFKITGGFTQTLTRNSTTDINGNLTLAFVIPSNTLTGSYNVGVYENGATTAAVTATLTVTPPTSIQLSPSTQSPGSSSSVIVTGTGFEAGESVTVGYLALLTGGGQQQISQVVQAGVTGAFTVSLPVPPNVVGGTTYTVDAVGATSGFTANATLTVSLAASVSASPTTVISGASVSISGSNFPGSATATITGRIPLVGGGAQPVSVNVQVGTNGTFVTQIPVPSAAATGSVTLTVSATTSGTAAVYTASTTFNVTNVPPTLSLGVSTAAPSDQVSVSGANFSPGPNAPVTLTLTYTTSAGQKSASQSVDSTASGNFLTTIAVPSDAITGTATISAIQTSSGETASSSLHIQVSVPTPTSTPTPTPTPTSTSTSGTSTPVRLKIKHASLWYETVRAGTFNHLGIQTNKKMRLPVIVRVTFPSGRAALYSGFTTGRGRWALTFQVPLNARSSHATLAHVKITVKRTFSATTTLTFAVIA